MSASYLDLDLSVSVVSFISRCRSRYEVELYVSVVSSRCRSRYEADLSVSVVSFISRCRSRYEAELYVICGILYFKV
jgi:hypothetical protein